MGRHKITTVSFSVARGEGHLIGDTLRKYALRGKVMWQIAGYKVDSKNPNFGFSSDITLSYLELLKGSVVCLSEQVDCEPKICKFTWSEDRFVCGDFEIHGLSRGVGNSLTVCLVFARGLRTAEKNLETIKKLTGGSTEGYFAVPSKHYTTETFRYRVEPIDDEREWLIIDADEGVVEYAQENVVRSFSGLNR